MTTKVAITVEVLESNTPVTQGQQAVLDAFKGQSSMSVNELVDRFGFESPLPLVSRLDHLVECGRLRIV